LLVCGWSPHEPAAEAAVQTMGEVGLLSAVWCLIAVALFLPSAERCQAPLSLILDQFRKNSVDIFL
jgi:hypothetical protein